MKKKLEIWLNTKPVLPGTLEKRFNVCGKPGCRCKDKVNPQKHGPYYRLSYNLKGKNSSIFVPSKDAAIIEEMTNNYREAKSNIQDLALSMVDFYRQDGLDGMLERYERMVDSEISKKTGSKPASAVLRETSSSKDKWKAKALDRKSKLNKKQVKIRDLEKSRASWKAKAMQLKEENHELLLKLAVPPKKTSD